MQSSWARWCQERLDPRLERGQSREVTGRDHVHAEIYAAEAEKARAEARKAVEAEKVQMLAQARAEAIAEAHRITQEARRDADRAQEARKAAQEAQRASEARTEALRAEIAELEARKADVGSFMREGRAHIDREAREARKAMEAEWNDQLEDIGRIRREAESEASFLRKALEKSERLHRIVLDCITRLLPHGLAETLRKAIREERDKDQPSRGPSAPEL